MIFNVISSGSKGNATIIKQNNTLLLIDMGISFIRLVDGLKEINCEASEISYIFITHNHSDHISGIKNFSPKKTYSIPGVLASNLSNTIEIDCEVKYGDFLVTPIKVSHDANACCGYIIKTNKEKLVYLSDLGIVDDNLIKKCLNPTYLLIESNHDIQMLMNTNRTYELKNRILSDVGHLCNEDSAFAASQIIGDLTKEIILLHLSEEANTPEKALQIHHNILKDKISKNLKIRCANQHVSLLGGEYEN